VGEKEEGEGRHAGSPCRDEVWATAEEKSKKMLGKKKKRKRAAQSSEALLGGKGKHCKGRRGKRRKKKKRRTHLCSRPQRYKPLAFEKGKKKDMKEREEKKGSERKGGFSTLSPNFVHDVARKRGAEEERRGKNRGLKYIIPNH